MRVLSGIQPTGRFHWGNYFGAIRQYIDLQGEEQSYYFIANLHALTTLRDAEAIAGYTLDAAIDLLALGLDPQRATLFIQSDVPEVSELCWMLLTGTPMGLLERCHAYKDKKAKGLPADAGLFTYPVLMAADILAYDSDTVPVGEDQIQHIEVCRDLAASFNHHFGQVFVMPKAKILDATAKVPGTDGEKMSKSYNNTLEIFEDPKAQRKKIMRITTDSRPMEQPKEPESDHLFQLYSLVADPSEREAMAALYRRGGFGYGDVKKALADAAERFFAPARARRVELEGQREAVREILADGAAAPAKRPRRCWPGPSGRAGWRRDQRVGRRLAAAAELPIPCDSLERSTTWLAMPVGWRQTWLSPRPFAGAASICNRRALRRRSFTRCSSAPPWAPRAQPLPGRCTWGPSQPPPALRPWGCWPLSDKTTLAIGITCGRMKRGCGLRSRPWRRRWPRVPTSSPTSAST